MSETNPPAGTDPNVPAPKPRRRRRWPWVILVLLILIVGLVLAAPMIISTTPVKNIVMAQVNKNLNGRVEIADWDIGWTSGVKVDGVRVFDQQNAQIAEMKSFRTELSLLDVAKGKIHLGETVVDSPNFNLKVREDGGSNFGDLMKRGQTEPDQTPGTTQPAEGAELDITGALKLVNATGTIEQAGKPTLHITNLNGGAEIDSLDQPIDHNLDMALKVGDKPAGRITLKGTASAKDGNVNNLNVNDTLMLADIDMASLRPLIPADAGVDTESGVTSGTVSLVIADGKSLTIDGEITGQQYAIGGPALKGDKFVTSNLKISLPIVVLMPNGPQDAAAMTIKTGGDKPAPIAIIWDQGSIALSADAPVSALQNLAANKPPGGAGKVAINADINIAALATMLPNTMSIPPEVKLDSGRLTEAVDLTIQPDVANFSVVTEIKNVAGTRDGKPVRIQPISVSLLGKALGSPQAMPDLRDVNLKLTSGFASADFKAPTISQLAGRASLDLKKMQDELAQIIDFQGKSLAGAFAMTIDTKGDPQDLSKPVVGKIGATLSGLVVSGAGERPITLDKLTADVDATLHATKDGALSSIDNTVVTVQTFQGAAATVDARIDNIAVQMGETMTASWNVSKLTADLAKLQDELKPFVKALQDAGPLDLGVLDAKLAGKLTQTKDATTASITGLSISESKGLFALSQPDGEALNATLGKNSMRAAGKLLLKADLKRASSLAKRFNKEVTADGKRPTINAGALEGTIELATVDAKNLSVTADLGTKGLSIDPGNGQTLNENVTLALRATAAQDFSAIKDTNLRLTGSFGEVKVDDVAVDLPKAGVEGGPAPLPVVTSAKLGVNITDMGRIDSLLTALSPPPAAADPAAPAADPTRLTAGSVKVAADVKQDGQTLLVNVTELVGNGLRLRQGKGAYDLKPITGKLAAKVQLAGDGAAQPITQVAVTEMDLNAGFANVSMTKPIVIDAPLGDAPKPSGAIKVAGRLQDLTEIPEALAGKKKGELYPYEGDYILTQDIAMAGNTITPKGLIEVTNFVVYKDGQPFVREPKVTIANDIGVDLAAKALKITQLIVDMPQSGALKVAVTGGVSDWESKRQLDNILIKLAGDWAKLWTIVKPMIATDAESQELYKDLTLAGTFDRTIRVGGYLPADAEGAAALKTVTAEGSIGIEKLTWKSNGINEANLIEIPFILQDGYLKTLIPGQPPEKAVPGPFHVNGGKVSIGNLVINLNDKAAPRLTAPGDYKLIEGVNISPALADRFGKILQNPLFVNSKEGAGILDVTLVECVRLPLSDIVMKSIPENNGHATVSYSIQNLVIGNDAILKFLQAIGNEEFAGDMRGSITNGTATIANGVVTQHTPVLLGEKKKPLTLDGKAYIETSTLEGFSISFSTSLLNLDRKDIAKYLPEGVVIAVRGKVDALQYDVGTVIQKMVVEAGKKALADQLLGGGRKNDDPNAKPDDRKNDDPIGGVLEDLLGGKKKKDDKKKR